jgi:hypothetical protein
MDMDKLAAGSEAIRGMDPVDETEILRWVANAGVPEGVGAV